LISETDVLGWLEPLVITVHSDQNLVFVLVVDLLEDLCDCGGGELTILKSNINEVDHFFRLCTFIFQSILKLLVSRLIKFLFLIVKETFPVIRPDLSLCIPCSRARLSIIVVSASHVTFAVSAEIDVHFRKYLLILFPQIREETLSKVKLVVEAIFHPLLVMLAIHKLVTAGNSNVDP